jgi:7 transmembrane helices usually fused to an inactive transglutaminase
MLLDSVLAEVVEWQTRRSQKPLEITLRGGSTPPLGTHHTVVTTDTIPGITTVNNYTMKYLFILLAIAIIVCKTPPSAFAQSVTPVASPTATKKEATPAAIIKIKPNQAAQAINEITNPEQDKQRQAVLTTLQNQRHVNNVSVFNFIPFAIQFAILAGVPTNTIVLILLLPLLATIVVAFRYIVGLSGIGLLVPIALSITLLATDVTPGFIMLGAIIIASLVSRFFLRRFPIMQMPKVALSMLMVAIFLLIALTISSIYGIIDVRNLSIFPILLFILLSDRIVTIFLERDFIETVQTTVITLFLAILGFLLLPWD